MSTVSISGMLSCCALLLAGACTFSCGQAETDGASENQSSQAGADGRSQVATISGSYIGQFSIVGDQWRATKPGQEISLTFHAGQLSQVRQFEIVLEPFPAEAFDFENATFAASQPFATFGSGVDASQPSQLRVGGATFGKDVSGDHALGTVRFVTSDRFTRTTEAWIRVRYLSLGPRSDQRDSFEAEELNLSVTVN